MRKKKEMYEIMDYSNQFLDLEMWLKIHYPDIFIEYEQIKKSTLIQE